MNYEAINAIVPLFDGGFRYLRKYFKKEATLTLSILKAKCLKMAFFKMVADVKG